MLKNKNRCGAYRGLGALTRSHERDESQLCPAEVRADSCAVRRVSARSGGNACVIAGSLRVGDMQASSAAAAGKGKYEDAKRMAADRRRRMAEAAVAERRAAALATVTAVRLRSRTSEDDERRRAKSADLLKFRTGPAAVDEPSPDDRGSDDVKLFYCELQLGTTGFFFFFLSSEQVIFSLFA